MSQTLQTSTQTHRRWPRVWKRRQSLRVFTVSPQESIPFIFHLGIAISFCPQDPLRSALVPPLWNLLRTGFCLWWGVWREVQSRSLLRPALVSRGAVASCLFSRACTFLGSSIQALELLKVFFGTYSLSFHGRGERSRVRQTERGHLKPPLERIYPSQPWGQGPA